MRWKYEGNIRIGWRSKARSKAGDNDFDRISVDEINDWKLRGPSTPLLDTVDFPVHLKNLSLRQLQQVCRELRAGLC